MAEPKPKPESYYETKYPGLLEATDKTHTELAAIYKISRQRVAKIRERFKIKNFTGMVVLAEGPVRSRIMSWIRVCWIGDGKTSKAFADALGIRSSVISSWCGGKREPTWEMTMAGLKLIGKDLRLELRQDGLVCVLDPSRQQVAAF